ncbi:NIPSNAP family containing protein [Micromonospora sp. DH14]|nr:NIPSNAP family containing protein [Micromonospora sp. DH14]
MPGLLDEWVQRWRTLVVPLRRQFGFKITGSWVDRSLDQHIWVVFYTGPSSFEEANAAYWASPERVAMNLNPRDYLVSEVTRQVETVL